MDSITAIIPARGGSKGIPGKNLKEVNGMSLIARTITLAQISGIFTKIVVSTDSPSIEAEALRYGAVVHHRAVADATDAALSEDALLSTISDLQIDSSHIGFLECTSPFIDPRDLRTAWVMIREPDIDSIFSASTSHDLHWTSGGGKLSPLGHDPLQQTPRQLRPPTMIETGAFYFFSRDGFCKHRNRFFGKIKAVEVPRLHSLEVDFPEDLTIANVLSVEIDLRIFQP